MPWQVVFAVIFLVLDACGEPATQSNLSSFTRGSYREDGGLDVGHG